MDCEDRFVLIGLARFERHVLDPWDWIGYCLLWLTEHHPGPRVRMSPVQASHGTTGP